MDQQGSAKNDQQDEDSIPGLEPYSNDSASDSDGDEYAAVESECSIVDETIRPSTIPLFSSGNVTFFQRRIPHRIGGLKCRKILLGLKRD